MVLPTGVIVALSSIAAFLAGRWSSVSQPGKPAILKEVASDVAPHLYSPPPFHGEVAVSSTVRDARGEVHNLRIGGFRFNVLVSEKGTLRSGDVHRNDQLDMIFSGHVQVTTRENGVDVVREYKGGDFLVIPAHTPHIFHFLKRTVMAEWWTDEVFECRYYRPYREKVDAALQDQWLSYLSKRDLNAIKEGQHANDIAVPRAWQTIAESIGRGNRQECT